MTLQQGAAASQLRQRSPRVAGSALRGAAGGSGEAGVEGKAAGWQPYGQWEQQKSRLLQQGLHERSGSDIPAAWGQQALLGRTEAEQDTTEEVRQQGQQDKEEQEEGHQLQEAAGSRSTGQLGSSSSSTRHGPRAHRSAVPAPATLGLAASHLLPASGTVPAFPATAQQHRQQRQQQVSTASGLSTPQKAAALAAFGVVAAEVAESPVPPPVPPSPVQYSPESQRYRQHAVQATHTQQLSVQQLSVGAPAAVEVLEVPEQQYSPGSQRYRQQAQQAAQAIASMQLRRVISEQEQLLIQQAEEAAQELEAAQQMHLTPTSRYHPPQHQDLQQQAAVSPMAATPAGTVVGSGGGSARSAPAQSVQRRQEEERAAAVAAVVGACLTEAEQVMSKLGVKQIWLGRKYIWVESCCSGKGSERYACRVAVHARPLLLPASPSVHVR